MVDKLKPWEEGDALSATRLNMMQGPVNDLIVASGNIVHGPGGLSFPQANGQRNVAKVGYLVDAFSEDESTYFDTGDCVILTEQIDILENLERSQAFAVNTPSASNYMRQIGIVVDPISPDGPGTVAIKGWALARTKRVIATADTDGNAFLTDNRAVARILHTSTAGTANITDPQILRVSFGVGCGDVMWEDTVETSGDLEQEHWALISLPTKDMGCTLAEITGTVSSDYLCKFVELDGTVQGEEIWLPPMDGDSFSVGDRAIVVLTVDGYALKALGCGSAEIKLVQAIADGSSGSVSVQDIELESDLTLSPNFTKQDPPIRWLI